MKRSQPTCVDTNKLRAQLSKDEGGDKGAKEKGGPRSCHKQPYYKRQGECEKTEEPTIRYDFRKHTRYTKKAAEVGV